MKSFDVYVKFYPDLQYYRRELREHERILKYVSLYVQDKICICILLNLHRYLMLDRRRQELKSHYESAHEILRLDRLPF